MPADKFSDEWIDEIVSDIVTSTGGTPLDYDRAVFRAGAAAAFEEAATMVEARPDTASAEVAFLRDTIAARIRARAREVEKADDK